MRTAVFYSCKGGSGRTLTLANMAALLVRLGYDVLAIDLDLEAPGLPEALHKFEPTDPNVTSAGFVEYARDWLRVGPRPHGAHAASGDRPKLEVHELTQAAERKAGSAKGPRLRLVRAGNYEDPAGYDSYAEFMRGGYLETLFPLPPSGFDLDGAMTTGANGQAELGQVSNVEVAQGESGAASPSSAPQADQSRTASKITEEEREYIANYRAFWEELREQIANDPPDYLMVDTRTGFSPLSSITVDAFLSDLAGSAETSADLFVFADRGSEASRLGTQAFVRQIDRRLKNSPIPRRTWIVRREQSLAESVQQLASSAQSPEEWLSEGSNDVSWTAAIDGYLKIRSDPEVELNGDMLASPDKDLVHRALLDDYIALAANLIDRTTPEDLRNELGLRRAETYKLFRLPGTGGMYNVADSERNVSFSEGTFNMLVEQLVGGALGPTSLAAAGQEAGREFGDKLTELNPGDRVSALDLWQELDSASGWGLFELHLDALHEGVKPPQDLTRKFLEGRHGRRIQVHGNQFAPQLSRLWKDIVSKEEQAATPTVQAGESSSADRDPGMTSTDASAPAPEKKQKSDAPERHPANLCPFLGGYLAGILSTMTDSEVETDPGDHLQCQSLGDEYCEFEFKSTGRIASGISLAPPKPKICLIYTGGTIGMRRDAGGELQPPKDPRDFLRLAPELREIVEYDFVPLLNKDSTNVVPGDWVKIADAIWERRDAGYDGFVVVHGTDTMHFSASAVAFALGSGLPFPVVFTGAQTIPEVRHGDARVNLLRACTVATEDLAEVVIAFGDFIFRGTRAQKKDERKFDAFESPALFPLGFITEDIRLSPNARHRSEVVEPFVLQNHFEVGVLQVSLIPGLEPSLLVPAVEAKDFKGLILQSFGAGNVPDENADAFSLIPAIRLAVDHAKPVIVTSQFPANATLHTAYAPGRKAVEAGAIPTGNMTASCSVAKFRWALALPEIRELEKTDPAQRLERLAEVMSTSIVGELDKSDLQPEGKMG